MNNYKLLKSILVIIIINLGLMGFAWTLTFTAPPPVQVSVPPSIASENQLVAVVPLTTATPSPTPGGFSATLQVLPSQTTVQEGDVFTVTIDITTQTNCDYTIWFLELEENNYFTPIAQTIGPGNIPYPVVFTVTAIASGDTTLVASVDGEGHCAGGGYFTYPLSGESDLITIIGIGDPTPTPIATPSTGYSATLKVLPAATTLMVNNTLTVMVNLDLGGGCPYSILDLNLEANDYFEVLTTTNKALANYLSTFTLIATQPGTTTLSAIAYGEYFCDGAWSWHYVTGQSELITIYGGTFTGTFPDADIFVYLPLIIK